MMCNVTLILVFSSFKVSNIFGVKDPIPCGLHASVAHKFLCARAVVPAMLAKPPSILIFHMQFGHFPKKPFISLLDFSSTSEIRVTIDMRITCI